MIVDNGDAAQVELLMQDRDSIRLWKEMILEDNARLSSETIRLRRENDAVIRENERLKKVRRHLVKVRETSRGKVRLGKVLGKVWFDMIRYVTIS